MKVLVTGASGFIGRAIVQGLAQASGVKVIGLSRTLPAQRETPGATLVSRDLAAGFVLDEAVDYVIHCAAVRQGTIPEFIAANLAITENVARYCKAFAIKGLIFTSSISLHGEVREPIVDAATAVINPTVYGVSKVLCERILQEYQESFPVIALRLCGVVGTGAETVWLSRVLSAARRGEDIHVVNPERQFNNVLHTDDIVHFVNGLMTQGFSGFHAFPIAAREPVTIRSIAETIVAMTSSAAKIIDDGISANSFMISNDVAVERFRYEPQETAACIKKYILGERGLELGRNGNRSPR